jgi:hypothetical protein
MLLSGLKNSILLILIILILHFLIKNVMLDMEQKNNKQATPPEDNKGGETNNLLGATNVVTTTQDSQKALLDFVMSEGPSSDDKPGIEKYFEPIAKEDFLEGGAACDPNLQVKGEVEKNLKIPKAPSEQKGNFLVISEYANEHVMNGGELLNGVGGFDGYDTGFGSYACL